MRFPGKFILLTAALLFLAGCGLISVGGGDIPSSEQLPLVQIQGHTAMDWTVDIVSVGPQSEDELDISLTYPEYMDRQDTVWFSAYRWGDAGTKTAHDLSLYLNEVSWGEPRFKKIIDKSGHIQFSVYDKDDVKKSYDIVVSPLLEFLENPFEVRGDSVALFAPAGINTLVHYGKCDAQGPYYDLAESFRSGGMGTAYNFSDEPEESHVVTIELKCFKEGYQKSQVLTVTMNLEKQSSMKTDKMDFRLRYVVPMDSL